MNKEVTVYENSPSSTLIKSLEAPALDPVILALANEHLAGKDYEELSREFGVNKDVVTQILNKKEVKSYIDTVFLNQGYLNRQKLSNLINQVVEAKVVDALESGEWSKKDLLDWLKFVQTISVETQGKEKGPQVQVNVQNNYMKLMKELFSDN